MNKTRALSSLTALLMAGDAYAVDSYRFLHVTIDTPWAIFIFLLPMVLIPVILMVILQWYFAKPRKAEGSKTQSPQPLDNSKEV